MTNMRKDSVNESLNNHIDKFVKKQTKKTNKEQEELSYIIELLTDEASNNINDYMPKKYDKRLRIDRNKELSNKELINGYKDIMTKNSHFLYYMNLALNNPDTLETVKNRYVEAICNPYINKIGLLNEEDLNVLRKYNNILPIEEVDKPSIRKYDGVMKKASYNIIMATAKRLIESSDEKEDELQLLRDTQGELIQLKRDYINLQLEKEELLEEEKRIVSRITELSEKYLALKNRQFEKTVNNKRGK